MATYYISNAGSDAANGTSTGTSWQTIAKVNGTSFSAGDSILFNKGDVWREQLTIPSSGTAGNVITFGAYGTGAKPIINGANVTTGWTNAGSNQWWVNNPNAVTTRAMVVIGGVIYAEVASLAAVNSANEYFIDTSASPDRVYVYSTVDPATLTAEISTREYCIMSNGSMLRHHITIDGIEVRYAGRAGIYFEGVGADPSNSHDGATLVTNCLAYANRIFGVAHYDHHDNLTCEDSEAYYNGNGFYSWEADEGTFRRCTTGNQIHYEDISAFTDGGAIQSYRGDNWLVEYCISDADYDSIHIAFSAVAANGIIRYNKVYNSRAGSPNTQGIGTGGPVVGTTIQIYYNLMVNCSSAGFETYSANNGTVLFYNNTIYNNISTATLGSIYLGTNGTNFVFKNNLVVRDYVSGKTTFVNVGANMSTNDYNNYYILNNIGDTLRNWHNGATYTTMAAWRTATSQDANSITTDPLFVNVASDWSLQSGSPCINAGVDVGLTQDILSNPVGATPTIGAYEFGSFPITFKGRNIQII